MDDYNEKTERISELANNPDVLSQHISNHIQGISQSLPGISQGLSTSIANSIQYLNSKIPRPPINMPLSHEWEPSEMHKQVFNEHYEAVSNPISVLKQIKDGELSSQTMESLQACHPHLLNEMRQKMTQQMNPDKVRHLPLHTQESISMFLGQPLSGAMLQPVRMANQLTFQSPAQSQANQMSQNQKSPQSGLQKLNIAERTQTETNRDEKV